jgi:ABC-type transport system substrate-binding protein
MIMNIRILAASVLALSLLAPTAFAGNSFGNPNAPAGSEVSNQNADYPDIVDVGTSYAGSSQALAVPGFANGKVRFNTGEYIDETNVERNQRSSR